MSNTIIQQELLKQFNKVARNKDIDIHKQTLDMVRCAGAYAKLSNTKVKAIRAADKLNSAVGNVSKLLKCPELA